MSYTVLARRYRSQTFDDVVGQDAIAQTLKNAIQTGRVAHAYLFCGTRGVGKTTMARILAKSLNCLTAKDATVAPCLKCDSCIAINAGEDIDVVEIDGASNRGIDNIRELRQNAIYRPARARYKIYIVDEVHMLTTEAFNALLKILEEPPAHVKFIFATTEPNKVLPTIQSRCQRFDFAAIGPQTIAKQLDAILKIEKITFEPDFLAQLSRLANGSMRDALSLLDQLISSGQQPLTAVMLEQMLGRPDSENLNRLIRHIAAGDPAQTLKSIEVLLDQGQSASQIAESLVEMFRDMMVLKTAGKETDILLLSCAAPATLIQLGQTFDIPWLVFAITAIERLRWTLRNSETARALLEATLLRLAMSEHFISLDALAEQLDGGAAASSAVDLKKKIIPVSVSTSSFKPAALASQPQPAQQPAAITQNSTPGSMQDIWRRLLETMQAQNTQTAGFLAQAQPAELRNNMLFVRSFSPLALDIIKKKDDLLRAVLKDITGTEIRIQYDLAKPGDPTAQQPAAPAAAGARLNRKQHEEAVSDPAVQIIMRALDAKATLIERIDDAEQRSDTEDMDV